MESRVITIEGKGDFTLELEGGALTLKANDTTLFIAQGDPSKRGKPPFASLDEAEAYFRKTSYAEPILAPVDDNP